MIRCTKEEFDLAMLVLGLRGTLPFPDNVCPLVKKERVDVGLEEFVTPPSMDVIWRGASGAGESCVAVLRENFRLSTCICLFPLLLEAGCKLFAVLSSSESFDSAEFDAATVSEVVVVELLLEYKLPMPSNLELLADSLYFIDTRLAVVPIL